MQNGWTMKTDRLPLQSDADVFGCVLAWHVFSGVMVTGWRRVEENDFIIAWRRTPEGPGGNAHEM